MLVSSSCVLCLLWRPGRVCASLGSWAAPTEACKACQCILRKSEQRSEPSIMEKTQNPSPGHLGERAGHTSPGSRGSRPVRLCLPRDSQVCAVEAAGRQYLLPSHNGAFVHLSFSLSPAREVEHNGAVPTLGNSTRFSLGFPGLGTWKMPEPRQTRAASQILRCAFPVAIRHVPVTIWWVVSACGVLLTTLGTFPEERACIPHRARCRRGCVCLCACGCLSHRTRCSC